jgi:hypothetical protein
MRPVLTFTMAGAFAVVAAACGGGSGMPGGSTPPQQTAPPPVPPPPAAPPAFDLAGAWNGTAADSQGVAVVSWTLGQSGSSVSGTVSTQAVNPSDGSCNSCHRNKTGTVSGTLFGSTLTLSLSFPPGVVGDPTPICTATMTVPWTGVAQDNVHVSYSGSDSCEGPFLNGDLTMARAPQPQPMP